MSATSKNNGFEFETENLFPRAWFRLEDGFSLGSKLESNSTDHMAYAFNELMPDSEYDIFTLFKYRNGELADTPSEVVIRSKDEEDFTMWAYSVQEPSLTTDVNTRLDDRRDHLPVTIQATQGQDHGYAHRNNFSQEDKRTLGELDGLVGDILRGRDDESWGMEQETGAWTSKMDPTLIDWYRDVPRGVDIVEEAHNFTDSRNDLEQVAVYLDNFRDTIDVIVADYESEPDAWEDMREGNYESMAEHVDDISAEGLKGMLEELPSQMEKLTETMYRNN